MTSPTLKEDAEVLRQGLLFGVGRVDDAIAWADALIENEAPGRVPTEVLDVSLCAAKPDHEVAQILSAIPGNFDDDRVVRRLLVVFRDWLSANPDGGRHIARALMTLWSNGRLPEERFGMEPSFLDEYYEEAHLFEPGAGDTEVRAFLGRHAAVGGAGTPTRRVV
jgi:hypothetical protein